MSGCDTVFGDGKGKKLADIPRDCPVAVRIGLFFDGTGNNLFNDLKDGTGNDTNVVRLFELYHASDPFKGSVDEQIKTSIGKYKSYHLFSAKEYEVGTGTRKGEENNRDETATGAGEMVKIHRMLSKLEHVLKLFNGRIGPRIVDLFGFSRGASNARYFLNYLRYKKPDWKITFGFVGIFDTVGSFGLGGTAVDPIPAKPKASKIHTFISEPKIRLKYTEEAKKSKNVNTNIGREARISGVNDHLNANKDIFALTMKYFMNLYLNGKSAEKVVHLTANHELRDKFSLVSIQDASKNMAGNFEEIACIGVHADVGGGYGTNYTRERFEFVDFFAKTTKLEGYKLNAQMIRNLQQELDTKKKEYEHFLQNNRFENDFTFSGKVDWDLVFLYEDATKSKNATLSTARYKAVTHRTVNYGLSIVYLHLMYKKAKENGVPLFSIDELISKEGKSTLKRFTIPPALDDYMSHCLSGKPPVSYSNKKTLVKEWMHVSGIRFVESTNKQCPSGKPR